MLKLQTLLSHGTKLYTGLFAILHTQLFASLGSVAATAVRPHPPTPLIRTARSGCVLLLAQRVDGFLGVNYM